MISRRSAVVSVVLSVVVGVLSGTGIAIGSPFSTAVGSTTNSFQTKPDLTAPTLSAAIGARGDGGGVVGEIRQGVGYHVYANVSDTGNPASGAKTITANTSSFDADATAVPLTPAGGPWLLAGTSYTYRSGLMTADTPLSPTGGTRSYTVTMTDVAGNVATSTTRSVLVERYQDVVRRTSGAVNYWRLNESATTPTTLGQDAFSGGAGTPLMYYGGWTGVYGVVCPSYTTSAQITNAGRLRRSGNGVATYYSPTVPPTSGNYTVSANVNLQSLTLGEAVALVGRYDVAANSYYRARFINRSVDTNDFWVELARVINGNETAVAPDLLAATTLTGITTNQNYRLTLDMHGSTIRLLLDGIPRLTITDTSLSAGGRAGVQFGNCFANGVYNSYSGYLSGGTSDSAGPHLDDFVVTTAGNAPAADLVSSHSGTYGTSGITRGSGGAPAGDTDPAVTFSGSAGGLALPRSVQDDFSIEFWFKSSQGLTGYDGQWWGGAGLIDCDVKGSASDFGISLRADGRVAAGTGSPDVTVVSSVAGLTNNNWHHVVFTRVKSSGVMALYVDGASTGTATGTTASLNSCPTMAVGRLQSGTNYYTGLIDEIATYSLVLSSATIADHYVSGRGRP